MDQWAALVHFDRFFILLVRLYIKALDSLTFRSILACIVKAVLIVLHDSLKTRELTIKTNVKYKNKRSFSYVALWFYLVYPSRVISSVNVTYNNDVHDHSHIFDPRLSFTYTFVVVRPEVPKGAIAAPS
jgi:hypothetical protein